MPYTVELVRQNAGFQLHKEAWNRLSATADAPPFFSTWTFVSQAWTHSQQPGHSLFLLLVWEETPAHRELVAVAPLRRITERRRGLPIRTLSWIAAWEGDRPGLLCRGNKAKVWEGICAFLSDHSREWDILDLVEQDDQTAASIRKAFEYRRASIQTEADTETFTVSLQQSFEEYIASRPAKVRANWRNRRKRLFHDQPGGHLRIIDSPGSIQDAFERFVAIEQAGWKQEAGIGAAKDETHRRFYRSLLADAAERGEAAIYFLNVNNRDVAAAVFFSCGDVHYERHIAYAEDLAALSPGIVLRTEILAHLMQKGGREVDLLGLHVGDGGQQHKRDWATASSITRRITVTRWIGSAGPLLLARALRRWSTYPFQLHDSLVVSKLKRKIVLLGTLASATLGNNRSDIKQSQSDGKILLGEPRS